MDNPTLNFNTTPSVNSRDLNFSSDISCRDVETAGGKISTGFSFQQNNKTNTFSIKDANCANLTLGSDMGNLKKGTILSDVCDCEIASINNGAITCPNNKFIKSYYPSSNKVSCCSPCTSNAEIKTAYSTPNCNDVNVDGTTYLAMCPINQFANGIDFTNSKVKCCKPSASGNLGLSTVDMTNQCKNLGITGTCNEKTINQYEKVCNDLGIKNCNYTNIMNTENICNNYGMKYYDVDTNLLMNPESYLVCNENNFADVDKFCKEKNITPCNWQNIQAWKQNTIDQLAEDVENIDTLQNSFEQTINRNTILLVVFIVILIVLLAIYAFIYIRKHYYPGSPKGL